MTAQDLQKIDCDSGKSIWSRIFSDLREKRTVLSLLILLAIVAVGLFLRLNELGTYGLFGDEIYSILVANGSGDPELIAFDSIRPVYFFLLNLWMKAGTSEVWLRLFSVFFGTINIALAYYLGQLAAGRKVGLVAAALMAFSPMEVHYSQLVRMYTLGNFFALLGGISLISAFQTQNKLWVFLWAGIRTLMVWTLPLTAVLLGVDMVFSFCKERKNKLFPAVLASFIVVLALYACFAWKMPQLTATSAYDDWRYGLPPPQVSDALMMLVNFTSTALPIQECRGPVEGGLLADFYSFAVLFLIALSIIPALSRRWLIWCSGWALIPVFFAWGVSQFTASFVITRYLMFASPFVFIILAAGWCEIWRPVKLRVFAVIAAMIYAVIMLMNLAYLYTHPVSEDWRQISSFIQEHEQAGDDVVVWNYHSQYLFNYYYRGKNKTYDVTVEHVLNREKTQMTDVSLDMPGLKAVKGRTWFVIREAPQDWLLAWTVYQLFKKHLEKNYQVIEHDKLGRTDLYLVTAK